MTVDLLTRAARRIRNATPDISGGRGGGYSSNQGVPPSQDMVAEMQAMLAGSTLFAVIDRLATTIGSVDWHLYRDFEPGTPVEDRTPVTAHPALTVWTRPNPHYSQRAFVESIVQHYDLTGEWAWLTGRMGGRSDGAVLELWPVRPDRIRPIPDPQRFISGFRYGAGQTAVDLATTDVLWTRRPNPLDPYRGISPVGSLLPDMVGDTAAAAWNAQFFANSARPDGVLSTPDTLTQDEFDSLVNHWRESHQGMSNAHRVAVLERATYASVGYSQKDMDFTALREFTEKRILRVYAMPKFMLGDSDGVSRANANAGKAMFAEMSMIPRLDLIREALNTQLLPLFGTAGRGVMFDYSDPIPPDREDQRAETAAKIASVQAMVALGADPVEACETFGLPPMVFDTPAPPVASPATPPAPDTGNPDDGSELA